MSLLYPELVSDEILEFFERYDGEYLPEDCSDLNSLADKLLELKTIAFKVKDEHLVSFGRMLGELNEKAQSLGKSRFALTADELTLNDVAISICYPFFDRWGGSFEARFALEGDLRRYLKIYKDKISAIK